MCTVVNKYQEDYDIYIGRGSIWGNPIPIDDSIGNTREVVIVAYRLILWNKIRNGEITIQQLKDLQGKRLGCFCKPKYCHGDIIAAAVEWATKQEI